MNVQPSTYTQENKKQKMIFTFSINGILSKWHEEKILIRTNILVLYCKDRKCKTEIRMKIRPIDYVFEQTYRNYLKGS